MYPYRRAFKSSSYEKSSKTGLEISESEHERASSHPLLVFQNQLKFFAFLVAQMHRLVARDRRQDGQLTHGRQVGHAAQIGSTAATI